MRKFSALIALVLVFMGFGGSIASADSSNQFSIPSSALLPEQRGGQVGYMIYGGLSVQAGLPVIFTKHGICDQPNEACLKDTDFVSYLPAYFKMCEQTTNSPCVVGLEAKKPESEEWTKATLVREISYEAPGQVGIGWDYQPTTGLPGSAKGPLLFNIPGFAHAGGAETYILDARYEMSGQVSDGHASGMKPGNLTLSIRPTNVQANPFSHTPERHSVPLSQGGSGLSGEPGGNPERTHMVGSEIGVAKRFANNDIQLRLSIQLPKSTVGWFHGRVSNPNINISDLENGQNLVTISASPIVVPITSVSLPYEKAAQLDPTLINPYWTEDIRQRVKDGSQNALDEWNAWSGFDTLFSSWFKQLSPNAKGEVNYWMVNTLPADQLSDPCFKADSQLTGIITTNAMAYQAGPPKFESGFLKYEVAGVHNDASGQLFAGSYNLIVRSDVARCLYGFTKAPISASVSVVDSKEGQVIATTNFVEKDGWIKFTAAGFGFSQKQINIKISQKQAAPAVKTLAGWAPQTKKLPTALKSQIAAFVSGHSDAAKVTCIGYYATTATKALATARATQVCAAAKAVAAADVVITATSAKSAKKALLSSVRIEVR